MDDQWFFVFTLSLGVAGGVIIRALGGNGLGFIGGWAAMSLILVLVDGLL